MKDLELADLRWIDAVVDRFEAAWRSGGRPSPEDFLGDATGERRRALIRALVQLDFEYGDHGDFTAYLDQHPTLSDDLCDREDLFDDTSNPANHRVILRVVGGSHEGRLFTFTEDRTVTIGSGCGAHFRLAEKDAEIAESHFELQLTSDGCHLTHLAPGRVTILEGRSVLTETIEDGALVTLGNTMLKVSIL